MATIPDDEAGPQETVARRIAEAVIHPAPSQRIVAVLAIAAAAGALAPAPFDVIAAAALTVAAFDIGSRRR